MKRKNPSITLIIWLLLTPIQVVLGQNVAQVQEKRWNAMIDRDSAALAKWVADDLIYVHSNGLTETKSAHITHILGQKIVYQSFTYLEPPTVYAKRRMEVLNGKVTVKGYYDGKPFEVKLSFLAIYARRNGRWQLTRWQSTKI